MSGLNDKLELSAGAFIGGGENNIISDLPPYYNSNLSAIAGGIANIVGSPDSFIGAGQANTIIPPAVKLASGDSPSSFIGSGEDNTIASDYSVITGGYNNSVSGEFGSISGGYNNTVAGLESAIGGGYNNSISAPTIYAAIGGGANNSVSGSWATIAGGSANSVSGGTAFVGGGYQNSATGQYAAIAAGHANVASGFTATIGGGSMNVASGFHSAIPGGDSNIAAGFDSFAAGTSSDAANDGTFVWSDDASGATVLKSTASNQFLVRASGGLHFYSNATLKSGVYLSAGSGTWSSLSDRNMKTNVVEIDPSAILLKVAALPITEWSYRTEDPAVRHVGPMAQDFYAAFGVGEDNRHVTTIDEEGVALAAIKALQAEVAAKDRKLADLDAKYARLEQRLDALAAAR